MRKLYICCYIQPQQGLVNPPTLWTNPPHQQVKLPLRCLSSSAFRLASSFSRWYLTFLSRIRSNLRLFRRSLRTLFNSSWNFSFLALERYHKNKLLCPELMLYCKNEQCRAFWKTWASKIYIMQIINKSPCDEFCAPFVRINVVRTIKNYFINSPRWLLQFWKTKFQISLVLLILKCSRHYIITYLPVQIGGAYK